MYCCSVTPPNGVGMLCRHNVKQRLHNLIANFRKGKKLKWKKTFFPSLHTLKKRVQNSFPPPKKIRKQDESLFDNEGSILDSQSSFTIPLSDNQSNGSPPSPIPLSPFSPSKISETLIVSPLNCLLSPSSRVLTPFAAADAEVALDGSCADAPLVNDVASETVSGCNRDDDVSTVCTADAPSVVVVDKSSCVPTAREIVVQLQELETQAERCKKLDFRIFRRLRFYVCAVRQRAKTAGIGDVSEDYFAKATAPTSRVFTKREIAAKLADLLAAVEGCYELDIQGCRKFTRAYRRLQGFITKYRNKVYHSNP